MTENSDKPVALVRVKHGGYSMELARHIAYALPEGDHWLYSRPTSAGQPASVWLIERRVDPPQWSSSANPSGVGDFYEDVQRAHRFPTKARASEAMRRMSISSAERGEYFVSEHIWMDNSPTSAGQSEDKTQ